MTNEERDLVCDIWYFYFVSISAILYFYYLVNKKKKL